MAFTCCRPAIISTDACRCACPCTVPATRRWERSASG